MKQLGIILLLTTASFMANAESVDTVDVVTVNDVKPVYPASALRRDKSGSVTLRFDLNEKGKAENVRVIEASPDKSFISPAVAALKKSSFQLLDGQEPLADNSKSNVVRVYRFSPESGDTGRQDISMN